ncbi:MAG TPA: hypothetical protein VIM92_10645 [Rhodanobacteraceae bacterium]
MHALQKYYMSGTRKRQGHPEGGLVGDQVLLAAISETAVAEVRPGTAVLVFRIPEIFGPDSRSPKQRSWMNAQLRETSGQGRPFWCSRIEGHSDARNSQGGSDQG